MAKFGSVLKHSNGYDAQHDIIVSLFSVGVLVCMVFTVFGIKLKWFKRRIYFEQVSTGDSRSVNSEQVIFKRSSKSYQEHIREPVVVHGIFRKKLDEDIIIERPKSLPPVKISNDPKSPESFVPTRRSEIPISIKEPIVIPPTPPPLPSASSLSISTLGESPSHDNKKKFNSISEPIVNGNYSESDEQSSNDEEEAYKKCSERKPTEYVRPSDEIIQELLNLANEAEKPDIKPRSKFKKNDSKIMKSNTEPDTHDEELENKKFGQRRLTGIYPSSEADVEKAEDFAIYNSEWKPNSKVKFDVDESDDVDTDEDKVIQKNESTTRSVLFGSQISSDDDSFDNSSAVQKHKNLIQEIIEHQNKNTMPKDQDDLQNSLSSQSHDPKPRTMRDMKRNNARNDLLFNSERDYKT